MEKRSTPIGEVLSGLGIITASDVERALAHQRSRGGYFGDALVELGLVSVEQVKFGLADQYDLPYVRLHPETIDLAVARLVPAEWAREHLILPVLRDANRVTVILTVPPSEEELAAVRRFTKAEHIEAAVSTEETIRALLDAVHNGDTAAELPLQRWLAEALAVGATSFGVSARGDRIEGWYRVGGVVRRNLGGQWMTDLRHAVAPMPELRPGQVEDWPAILSTGGRMWRVECSAIRDVDALEWVARISAPLPVDSAQVPVPPALRERVAAALGKGPVTVSVCSDPGQVDRGVLEAVLTGLPAALTGSPVRTLHLVDRAVAVPTPALSVRLDKPLSEVLTSLQAFALEALTLDVRSFDAEDLATARRVAPLAVVRSSGSGSGDLHFDFDLCLRADGDDLLWTTDSPTDGAD